MPYCPDEGDFIWINFDPQASSEQAGRRAAIVLSPRSYNQRSRLCVLCPITTQVKNYPLELPVPTGGKITGVVLADQVKSMSWDKRNADFAEAAPAALLARVRQFVKALLKIT